MRKSNFIARIRQAYGASRFQGQSSRNPNATGEPRLRKLPGIRAIRREDQFDNEWFDRIKQSRPSPPPAPLQAAGTSRRRQRPAERAIETGARFRGRRGSDFRLAQKWRN